MTFQALYGDWKDNSRRTWGWAAILILAGSYFLSALLASFIQVFWIVDEYGPDALLDSEKMQEVISVLPPPEILFSMLLVNFLLWGAFILFWFKVFENRSFASIGMGSQKFLSRFVWGLLTGIGMVVLLGAGVMLVQSIWPTPGLEEALGQTGDLDINRLNAAALAPLFLAIIVFFLIQGGMEEVVVRGWLMSTLTARWGAFAGVMVSSIAFALLHFQHVLTNGLVGFMPMIGIFFTGLFFALLAFYQRSIWGAFAAHGAFNATAILGPVTMIVASDPEITPTEAIMSVFEQAAGLTPFEGIGAESFVQSGVFGLLSLFMLFLISRRKKTA